MSGVAPRLDVALRGRLGSFGYDVAFASPGSVTALFGPSGAGKSSIASAIAGIVKPDAGHVRLDGTVFFDAARGVNVPPHRRGIGYVFQDARLFPHLSVERNLRFGLERARGRAVYAAFDDVVSLLAIGPLLGRKPRGLSGGERQRVAIARAIVNDPLLIFADEPTGNLDTRTGEQIMQIFRELNAGGVTIVLVTHEMDVAVQARRIVQMRDGRVVSDRRTEDVLREDGVPRPPPVTLAAPV